MNHTTERITATLRRLRLTGILVSVAGIGVMIFAFVLVSLNTPTQGEQDGSLLLAIGGFIVAAAGTDLRVNARRAD